MKTDRHSFSSADATGAVAPSSQNVIAQINSINEQITKLANQKRDFIALVESLKTKQLMARSCQQTCKHGNTAWVDGSGVCWCASDSTTSAKNAGLIIGNASSEIQKFDSKIEDLNKQLKALNDSLPNLAKSDPAVIAANAAAQEAVVKAQGSSKVKTILWVTTGVLLVTLIGFWAYRRAVRK